MKLFAAAVPALALFTLVLAPLSPDQPSPQFRDVAKQAGVTPIIVAGSRSKNYVLEVNGSGLCWFDYNNDGFMDLYVVNGSTLEELQGKAPASSHHNYLFRNNRDG